MKPYLKKQETNLVSLKKNMIKKASTQSSGKGEKWEIPINKRSSKSKISQSSFTLSSVTLSSSDEVSNQYKKNRQKLMIKNNVKQQICHSNILKSQCKIEQRLPQKQQQKLVQRQSQTINNSQIKMCKVIDIMYQPSRSQNVIQDKDDQLKKQDCTQDSLFFEKIKSTSDLNQSKENTNTKQRLQIKNKQDKLSPFEVMNNHVRSKFKKGSSQIQKKINTSKKTDCFKSNTRSRQKSTKDKQKSLRQQIGEELEQLPFNLDDMRNCKCCGKLITKLCFRCPHIYCNADNCARKKKQLLNQRMLQKMKQDKIQEHYRQREMFEQRFKKSGTSKVKQQYKFNNEASSQEEQQNQDSQGTNQLCQQSSQDESSQKTLMFLKKNQKKSKKQNKKQYKNGIIKRTKDESQESQNKSSNKRNLRKKKKAQLYQDSDQ